MDRQGRMEKENKTLGAKRCVHKNKLYIFWLEDHFATSTDK